MTLIPTHWLRSCLYREFARDSLKFLFLSILHIVFCFTIKANSNLITFDTCIDFDKPVITIEIGNCTPAVFSPSNTSCLAFLSLTASAIDNQTPDELLSYTYQIDLYNDQKGKYNGYYDIRVGPLTMKQFNSGQVPIHHDNPFANSNKNVTDASGTYPIGIHKICWYVSDSCGNIGALCQLFEITDCEKPVANCVGGVQIFSMPVNGCITLVAKDFNIGSFDNCTSSDKLRYYFNGDPSSPTYVVCCDDFVAAGVKDELSLILQVWVRDEEGNANYCHVVCLIQDNRDICGIHGSGSKIIGELIAIKNGNERISIPDIDVSLYQGFNLMKRFTSTDKSRNYLFGDLQKGSYILNAKRYNDSLNSVSTLDLIYLQKHLLKIDTFSNKLQFISGDINGSGDCNASDIVEIRKLILRSTLFTYSLPWKIFPGTKDSNTLTNLTELAEINIGSSTTYNVDFRIIKMGDVNDFVSPFNYRPLAQGTSDSLIIKYRNQIIKKGEKVKLDFSAEKFNSIVGFQGTIKYDNQKLQFINIEPVAIAIDNNNIGIKYIKQGFLTMSWYDVFERTYPSGTILFSIEFEALIDGDLCDALSFTSDLTPAEAYTDSVLIKSIELEACDVVLNTSEFTADKIHVYPNPTKDEIHFDFLEEFSSPIKIYFFSKDGKIIGYFDIPQQTKHYVCKVDQLPRGMYFIKISEKNKVTCKKFIKS